MTINLKLTVRLNQECEALLNRINSLGGNFQTPSTSFKSFANISTPQIFKRPAKISQIIPPFNRNSNPTLKNISTTSRAFETFNFLVENDIMENLGPRHTDNLMNNVFERQKLNYESNLLKSERHDKLLQLRAYEQKIDTDALSELENAPLDSFLDLNDIRKEINGKVFNNDFESKIEDVKIPAHEKIRKGLMKFIGVKTKLNEEYMNNASPRMIRKELPKNISSTIGYSESDSQRFGESFTRKPVVKRSTQNYARETEITKKNDVEKNENSGYVYEFIKNQNTRITQLQDRIQILEASKEILIEVPRKSVNTKRSMSMSVVSIPGNVLNASVKESESDINEWVEEQVKRSQSTKNEDDSKIIKESVVKSRLAKVNREVNLVMNGKEEVARMDSGIGASRGTSSEDVLPEVKRHEKRKVKKSGHKGLNDSKLLLM